MTALLLIIQHNIIFKTSFREGIFSLKRAQALLIYRILFLYSLRIKLFAKKVNKIQLLAPVRTKILFWYCVMLTGCAPWVFRWNLHTIFLFCIGRIIIKDGRRDPISFIYLMKQDLLNFFNFSLCFFGSRFALLSHACLMSKKINKEQK